ncbi:hypothetical protein ABT143_22215 [Streptomyces sp. NPDC002033]|uniref:hypothetical protein n=1 Tax=unclassified Streptomyces TaxID=2593676 RepID=UPI00331EAAFC
MGGYKDPSKRPTPHEVATYTAGDQAGEWLPGAVLAQLGRRAAHLLDYVPAPAPAATADLRTDPRVQLAKPTPPPPAYAPTAPWRASRWPPRSAARRPFPTCWS